MVGLLNRNVRYRNRRSYLRGIISQHVCDGNGDGGGALIQCRIPEGSTHFIAMVGVDDNTPVKNCPVVFKVEVEGRELAKTRPMSLGEAHLVAVPLPSDAKMIKLFATAKYPVHAAWAGAGFRKAPL